MNHSSHRPTGIFGSKTDPGDDPPQVSPLPSRETDPSEELSLLNSEDDDEAIQAVMEMTTPQGERLIPGSISAQMDSVGGDNSYGLEEAQPAIENPIVAQLAHDDVDDIAARVTERLERRMTERLKREVEARMAFERLTQPVSGESMVNQVASIQGTQQPDDIQLAEEAPARGSTLVDDNFKICGIRRTCWGLILAAFFLLMTATLISIFFYFSDSDLNVPSPTDFSRSTTSPTKYPSVIRSTTSPTEAPSSIRSATSSTEAPSFSRSTTSPTEAPSFKSEWGHIMDRVGDTIVMDLDFDVFDDQSSLQYKAFNWLVNNDSYQMGESWTLTNKELIDRYALAVIYFAGVGTTWDRQLSFLEPVSVCNWNNGVSSHVENAQGVYCSDETVTFLQLVDNGLKGEIPREIGLLTSLLHLNLDKNTLYGGIPDLAKLTSLQLLRVSSNQLSGPLPKDLAKVTTLASLDLESNTFTGMIPSEWRLLSNLFFLGLRLNDIDGSLPADIFERLSNLRYLDLEGNKIHGTIPTQIGQLFKMESLYLEKNRLSGTLPTHLANLKNLNELLLYGNPLSGSVPKEYINMKSLTFFWIHGTDLSGTLDNIFCTDKLVQSLSADCAGDPIEISCMCCSQCCNSFGASCRQNLG